MKYWYLLLLGNCVAGSALAQHEGHSTAAQPVQAAASDAHAGHAKAGAPAAAADPHAAHAAGPEPAPAADPHAGHAMPAAAESADPHAGHTMPAAAAGADPHAGHAPPAPAEPADPHAGHTPPAAATAADPHAGHDMATMGASDAATRDQPPSAEAFAGPEHAADLLHDSADMARARAGLLGEHGDFRALFLMADQFELRNHDGEEALVWDAQGWYGGDIDKFWIKSEGEVAADTVPDTIEVQTLWSRALHPWFDFQAGARWDFESGFERSHLVLGFQGLSPYRFELDAAAFLSDEGDLSARVEAEYDLWLTQRLVLQPRLEAEFAASDIPERSIASGLSSAEFGARLQYQLAREFAPYAGVVYERLFSGTADAARLQGRDSGGWRAVLGVRSWF
ncbi:MAG: hypothetical protein RLZZ227_224 [Pseudomonadota bacterium]|jgi:copper resistance protein B